MNKKTKKRLKKKNKSKTIKNKIARNKTVKKINKDSPQYKSFLQSKIKTNLSKYKNGGFKSKKQVFAVSYKQTNLHFKLN